VSLTALLAAYEAGVIAESELFVRLARAAATEDLSALPPELARAFREWARGFVAGEPFVVGSNGGEAVPPEALQALRRWCADEQSLGG
jgi:hypothetical protein